MRGEMRDGLCYLMHSNELVRRQRGDMPAKIRELCSYSQDLIFKSNNEGPLAIPFHELVVSPAANMAHSAAATI